MEETIQTIYEKAHEEEYDNILIRDMQMRIEDTIRKMAYDYLESLGLVNIDDNIFKGELSGTDYDPELDKEVGAKYKLCLTIDAISVKIKSNNPEFGFD